MDLFNSAPGQYLVQSVLHAVIIAIVVGGMVNLWHLRQPALKIKFYLLILALPVLVLPGYYLYLPRTGFHFHEQVALFDSLQWLRLRLWADLSLWHLLAGVLGLTTVYFLVREALPALKPFFSHRTPLPAVARGQFPGLEAALARLSTAAGIPVPRVLVSADSTPEVYTLGHTALVLSVPAIDLLDGDELEAVLAHELAHLSRNQWWFSRIGLALRWLMFYNPVALVIFRRIITENEKLCDDLAIALTGKPLALASGLLKVSRQVDSSPPHPGDRPGGRPPLISSLESQACHELLRARAERMVHPVTSGELNHPALRLSVTAGLLVVLLFFVV